ncbi:MAG: hypothetical protein U5K31_14335 [Balneolaceae bacterium]|nr:hypothetical protein [Balneolaceae bacterium]
MKTLLAFVVLLMILAAASHAQQSESPESLRIANLEPAHFYDFWLGEWNLTWENRDGTTGRGTNRIERILGGRVIQENFSAEGGTMDGYAGNSWSVFQPASGMWKQTWVDNQGGYLDFTGAVDGDRRIFHRTGMDPQGNEVLQRMVFHEITRDSLTWDWERSADGGESWQLQWRIRYRRAQ